MSIRDEFAQEFKKHSMRSWDSRKPAEEQTVCQCGWVGGDLLGHQLNEVSKRFGIVELPEPDEIKPETVSEPGAQGWDCSLVDVAAFDGDCHIQVDIGGELSAAVTPAEARSVAAALLAAANCAEAQS